MQLCALDHDHDYHDDDYNDDHDHDDDYDDFGGRTQRDCLSLTAPDRRVSLTEAKTNTVCTYLVLFLTLSTGRNTNTVGVLNGK